MRADQWSRVIDVSLNGFFHVTQPLTMPMIRTRWGRIVNVSSLAALAGNRGQVNYAAAKAALHGATQVARARTREPRHHRQRGRAGHHRGRDGRRRLRRRARIAKTGADEARGHARRGGRPVAFLASPKAGYITGQVISINGGIPS